MNSSVEKEGSKHATSNGDQQAHEVNHNPDSGDAAPQSQESENANAKPNDPEPKSYERAIALWTTILGISTVVLAIATGVSTYFLWLTNRTMRETLVATQRPWVLVEAVPSSDWFINEAGINGLIKLTLKNVGHSPATNISVATRMAYPFGVDEAIELRSGFCHYTHHPSYMGIGHTIFPSLELNIATPISLKRDKNKLPIIRPIIAVCVVYRSAFNIRKAPGVEESHRTAYTAEVGLAHSTLSGITSDIDLRRARIPVGELLIVPTNNVGNYAN